MNLSITDITCNLYMLAAMSLLTFTTIRDSFRHGAVVAADGLDTLGVQLVVPEVLFELRVPIESTSLAVRIRIEPQNSKI